MTHADPLIGTTVAQYEVLDRLGGGGMGVVYRARDTKLGRQVALKFLPPQWSYDEGAKQRFIREAQAASATDHRNICTIHNIEETGDGRLFIVMALYEGRTLKQTLDGGALPPDEAIEIAGQIAEGLAKAHAQGVVHRDIKPGNVIVTDDAVKILDFGLAKFADALQLTIAGSTLGTAAYMSPEQARGEETDARSDVWALGIVLYEMLAGHVPFRGAYPEAISHAIRNEPIPPLRTPEREVSEDIERIVMKALQKDPAERFQSAREMARELRMLQGQTIPFDLRTGTLPPIPRLQGAALRHPLRRAVPAAVLAVALIGTPLWLFAPAEPLAVAVVPVVNQTGYPELDRYRLALTREIVMQLSRSRRLRVLSYGRLAEIVRPFRQQGKDVSGGEAVQAIVKGSGAPLLVIPTLVYDAGGWKARAELRRADTATPEATLESEAVVSSLAKETAYGLTTALAARIDLHARETGPARASLADTIRGWFQPASPATAATARTLDAADAFERGLDAYDELEYGTARSLLAAAAQDDRQNVALFAWRSRVARLMRLDDEAVDLAEQGLRLLSNGTLPADRLFVEAATAEARRDTATAIERFNALIEGTPGDPGWIVQLAAFEDRQGMNAEAIASFHRALDQDARLVRPHVELCRLYIRINDPVNARKHGRLAADAYRAAGANGGEAQALFCLTDSLRVGDDAERAEAAQHAAQALEMLQRLGHTYNLSRAHNYVALAADGRGDMAAAAAAWEQALTAAREAGNRVLEPLVLMNLGTAYDKLGQHAKAIGFLRQSAERFEALGDQARAAENLLNVGAMLIAYGGGLDEGRRNVENAQAVFRKLGNRNFEIAAARANATAFRYAGKQADAERELNRAVALATERDLDFQIATSRIFLARSRFDAGDYASARTLLQQALPDAIALNAD